MGSCVVLTLALGMKRFSESMWWILVSVRSFCVGV